MVSFVSRMTAFVCVEDDCFRLYRRTDNSTGSSNCEGYVVGGRSTFPPIARCAMDRAPVLSRRVEGREQRQMRGGGWVKVG
jgi:hypothetical protein